MTTTETTPATVPDIDKDPMWHQAYMDVQAVLDKALGTEEEDGAGGGIAGDVWLLAAQRDEARAKLAAIVAHCQAKASDFNATMPFSVRPEDIKVMGGDILAIISRDEEPRREV